MARVVLNDDFGRIGWSDAYVGLDCEPNCGCHTPGPGDPGGPDVPPLTRAFTIRERHRTFEDGTPVFTWSDLLAGDALAFEEREEFDPAAGLTLVRARLVMNNPGGVDVHESAIAVENNRVWRITSTKRLSTGIEFQLELIDGG